MQIVMKCALKVWAGVPYLKCFQGKFLASCSDDMTLKVSVCKFATKNRWISVKIEEMITDLNLKVWTMDKDGCVHDLQVSLKSLQHNNLCILPIRGWTLLLFISSAQREELNFTSNVSAQQPIICCPGSPEGDLHHKMESNRSRDTESQHEFGERAHLNKFFHACYW